MTKLKSKAIHMYRYINYAIVIDFVVVLTIGMVLNVYSNFFHKYMIIPRIENINNFSISLITVCATIIGFLLTIITVIVTFKKGFEDTKKKRIIETKNVFENIKFKEDKFYDSDIHKNVVKVFVYATYEIGFSLFALITRQFNIVNIPLKINLIIVGCIFLLIVFSIIRCLYIFQLFLNVHLHSNQSTNY